MSKFLFLDTETTGLDLEKDRLVQLCYSFDGNIRYELFKSDVPISVEASSVSHIVNKHIQDKEYFASSGLYAELQELLRGGFILVAHNAQFDIAMLKNEGIEVPQAICTKKLAMSVGPEIPKHGLQYLRYFFNLDDDSIAHDAKGDVVVLEKLFNFLIEKYGWSVEDMLRISSEPSRIWSFPFGKYINQSLEEVFKKDPGYLEWLYQQKKKDNDVDWLFNLNLFLKHDK